MTDYIINLCCPDQPGIVAAVATSLSNADCNIEHASQFNDPLSGRFFMRVIFAALSKDAHLTFQNNFKATADKFAMQWNIHDQSKPVKTLLMVSKQDHCLHDLLYRWKTGNLAIDITGIVSNHETARDLAESNNLPFHHLPITPENKQSQETALKDIIENTGTELIVLARYMQILSNEFSTGYAGRIINIHHSFLPGFKGAKPYHQAYERGVKIIGATAHFATGDLDEGPIIKQEIIPIDHSHTPEKLALLGHDIEAKTLRQAIELYCNRNIFLQENRTIILK